MEEQLVSIKVAKLLKEKKFNGSSFHYYYLNQDNEYTLQENSIQLFIGCEGGIHTDNHYLTQDELNASSESTRHIIASTQSLVQKWLRDSKDIVVLIDYCATTKTYSWYVAGTTKGYNSVFNTYEDALEEGLEEILKLI